MQNHMWVREMVTEVAGKRTRRRPKLWSLSYNSEKNYSIRAMVLYCSRISLPCLSRMPLSRVLRRLCVLLTFSSSQMPQLCLVFHLSCASGYLLSLSFLCSYMVQINYRAYNSYHCSSNVEKMHNAMTEVSKETVL